MLRNRISELKKKLSHQGELCLAMLDHTIQAIEHKDVELALQIIEQDEPAINEQEIEIVRYSVSTLALFHPEAKHLRRIVSTMQINSTLERIADICVNVSERLAILFKIDLFPFKSEMLEMLTMSKEMLHTALLAFEQKDVENAKSVFIKDDDVDDIRDLVFEKMIEQMKQEGLIVTHGVHIINLAQHIERMADLTTNISKSALYMITGELVEHVR